LTCSYLGYRTEDREARARAARQQSEFTSLTVRSHTRNKAAYVIFPFVPGLWQVTCCVEREEHDMSNTAVFGIYSGRDRVSAAVDKLRTSGFRNTDISALFPENEGSKDFAHEKNTKAPEGATAGGASGAVLGGALGWLAGAGLLAIPGIGPFIAAGPIMAALAGVGVGAVTGSVVGALVGFGMPEYEAVRYEGRIRHGGILLSVHCDDHDWVKRASAILKDTGAEDVASAGEASADFATSEKPVSRTSGAL
jgi:hypothetical protein